MSRETTYQNKELALTVEGIEIYRYLNVKHVSKWATKKAWLSGKTFIVDATDPAYYHFVFDNVGQFNAIKSVVKDLGLVIIIPPASSGELPDYITWCIDKLIKENPSALVVEECLYNLQFDALYVASPRLIQFFRLLEDGLFDLVMNDSYQDFVVPRLRGFFLRNLPKGFAPQKLYASSKSKNLELRLWKKYLNYLKDNGVSWDRETKTVKDPKGIIKDLPKEYRGRLEQIKSIWSLELEVQSRYISVEDEIAVENYYATNGFKTINHQALSYEEQMSLIASCDSYATITGASALNAIVCKEDAKISIIKTEGGWTMPNHEYLPTLISKNVEVTSVESFVK